jgi:hypothetical protein
LTLRPWVAAQQRFEPGLLEVMVLGQRLREATLLHDHA